MKETKNIDTENTVVADTVERTITCSKNLPNQLSEAAKRSHMWRSPGLSSRLDLCEICRCLMC